MNQIATKTLLCLLNPTFTINKIEFKKIAGYSEENLNAFVFFNFKGHEFISWETLPQWNNDGTFHTIQDKSIAININLANHIDFIDRTLFGSRAKTTGDEERYIGMDLASLLYDQLLSYNEMDMVNDKFKTFNRILNLEIINEEITKRKPIKNKEIEIFYEILQSYGIKTTKEL